MVSDNINQTKHMKRNMKRFAAGAALCGAITFIAILDMGCKTSQLEPGGAYAPDPEADWHLMIGAVVVLISVVVQGGLVPTFARLLRVPMRLVDPEPWSLGVRFRDEPDGLHRYVVAA